MHRGTYCKATTTATAAARLDSMTYLIMAAQDLAEIISTADSTRIEDIAEEIQVVLAAANIQIGALDEELVTESINPCEKSEDPT